MLNLFEIFHAKLIISGPSFSSGFSEVTAVMNQSMHRDADFGLTNITENLLALKMRVPEQ